MKKTIMALLGLCLLTIVSCSGGGGSSSDSSADSSSSVSTLVYSDSNVQIGDSDNYLVGMIMNPDNGESLGLIGNLDGGSVSALKAVTYKDPSGNTGYIEFDSSGLPASMKASDGSRMEYSNYGDGTVDITFFDANGEMIYGPAATEISNADISRLRSLYPVANLALREAKYGRISNSTWVHIWELASVAANVAGCAGSIATSAAVAAGTFGIGLFVTGPLTVATCASAVVSIAAAATDDPTIDYVATTFDETMCASSVAVLNPFSFLSCAAAGADIMANQYRDTNGNGGSGTTTGSGDSGGGSTTPAPTGSVTPTSVDVKSVTAGVESVTVEWYAPSDFSTLTSADYPTQNYIVCYQAGPIDSGATCVDVWRGGNSYTATGLTGGTQYCFGVKQRKDEIGDSDFGTTMCATPTTSGGGGGSFSDTFNSVDLSSWNIVGGTWTASGGQLTGSWSLSAAQTDQGNYLLDTSVMPQGSDFSATFTGSPIVGGSRFPLYSSAGNKYNVAFGPSGFEVEIRVAGAVYTIVNGLNSTYASVGFTGDCTAGTCVARLDKSGSTYTLYLNNFQIGQFTDTQWGGNTLLGIGAYGDPIYDDFSVTW